MVCTWVVAAQWVLSAQTLTLRVYHVLVSVASGSSHIQYDDQGGLVLTVTRALDVAILTFFTVIGAIILVKWAGCKICMQV